jgi:hypothetical protein
VTYREMSRISKNELNRGKSINVGRLLSAKVPKKKALSEPSLRTLSQNVLENIKIREHFIKLIAIKSIS